MKDMQPQLESLIPFSIDTRQDQHITQPNDTII